MSVQVVADIDNDLEVGVFLGAYRQLAQRQDLETRRLCAESCAAVLKAATPRRSANVEIQAFLHPNCCPEQKLRLCKVLFCKTFLFLIFCYVFILIF